MSIKLNTTFWIQFLGIIFGLGMLYFTFVKFKRDEIGNLERWGWTACWILLIIVAITPYILDPIIGRLNFYRRLDFFVVIGFFVMLSIGFYNYGAVKRMERKLEIFVRKQAAKEMENKEKK